MARHLDKSFMEQINRNAGIAHRVCGLYFTDGEERKDALQEMMYQLWRSYPSFGGRSRFSTWMYSVCLNTALTYRRKHAGGRHVPLSEGHHQLPEEPAGGKGERTEVLLGAVAALSPLNRAITLLYLEEMSYGEIAQVTGLSKPNVSVRLVRIKKELETILRKRFNSYSDVSS